MGKVMKNVYVPSMYVFVQVNSGLTSDDFGNSRTFLSLLHHSLKDTSRWMDEPVPGETFTTYQLKGRGDNQGCKRPEGVHMRLLRNHTISSEQPKGLEL